MAKTKKKVVRYLAGDLDTVQSACGIGIACDFSLAVKNTKPTRGWGNYQPTALADRPNRGGCGWLIAGFVNSPECQMAYNDLMGRGYTLLFQSPVRRNVNSGRQFFMCLWDTGEPADPVPRHDDEEDF